jgi:hypothetical protein
MSRTEFFLKKNKIIKKRKKKEKEKGNGIYNKLIQCIRQKKCLAGETSNIHRNKNVCNGMMKEQNQCTGRKRNSAEYSEAGLRRLGQKKTTMPNMLAAN